MWPTTHIVVLLSELDPVVVDPALVAQGDAALAGRGLGLPHQEAPVDAGGEEVLRRVPRDGAMVPGVLLQRVDRGDIVGGNPANIAQHGVGLTPFTGLVVREDSNLKKEILSVTVISAHLRQFGPIYS